MANEQTVNTAMLCYLCRRTAVIRTRGYTDLAPIGPEKEVLQAFLVTCAVCLSFPNSHDPATAKFPKYLDIGGYSEVIASLMYIFACSPQVLGEKKFSIGLLRIKDFTKVKDVGEMFDRWTPRANIMILKNGCEETTDCRFFKHETINTDRVILRYPLTADSMTVDFAEFPFASVANRPLIYVAPPLCPRCFADVSLPHYSSVDDKDSELVSLLG